jgi:hypothetical protein
VLRLLAGHDLSVSVAAERAWRGDLIASARRLSAGALGGLMTGAVIGGLGGRAAMFVLRLTSDPSLSGAETDDGFVIGAFSGATMFLVVFTAFLGVAGGLFYLAVRPWLPPRLRPAAMAAFGGIVGGAIVIRPGGIDFTALDPLALAIAMFIALPALYGFAMSVLVERLLAAESHLNRSRWLWALGLVPLVALGVAGVRGLILVVGIVSAWAIGRSVPNVLTLYRSVPVTWLARTALLGLAGFALVALVGDIDRIL